MASTSANLGKSNKKTQAVKLKNDIGDGLGREEMISVAAYYLAEYRGFGASDPLTNWLSAEAEIDAMSKN